MYCVHCGSEIRDEAVVCIHCGCPIESGYEVDNRGYAVDNSKYLEDRNNLHVNINCRSTANYPKSVSTLKNVAKAFMIAMTVLGGMYIIPLCWYIPMLNSYSNKLKRGEPISQGFKICILIFVSFVAGILLLCDNEEEDIYY